MLDRYMTFPFILGTQGDVAAVVREGTDEFAFCWLGSLGSEPGDFRARGFTIRPGCVSEPENRLQ